MAVLLAPKASHATQSREDPMPKKAELAETLRDNEGYLD